MASIPQSTSIPYRKYSWISLYSRVLQKLPAGHVEQASTAGHESRQQQCSGTRNDVLHVDANETSNQVESPQSPKHRQLACIHADFSLLNGVQWPAATSLPKVDHTDSAHSGANVRHGSRDVRSPNDGAEVRSAHGVLQSACSGHEACWNQAAWDKGCRDQQGRFQNESQAIERLAIKVHLVLVDEEATCIGSNQKREDQRACFLQGLVRKLALVIAFQAECDIGRAPRHMGCVEPPGLEGDHIGCAGTCGQAPAKTRHVELRPLEALADGSGFLVHLLRVGRLP